MSAASSPDDGVVGNCFAVAAGFAKYGARVFAAEARVPYRKDERGPFRICHGLPVGTSGEIHGLRHWHAWVEVTPPLGDVLVLDFSNGKQVTMARTLYYSIGGIGEDHVWRFTINDAERLLRKLRHVGPWVDGWEAMGDEHRLEAGS